MLNIFFPVRTGLQSQVFSEICELEGCVFLLPYEMLNLNLKDETELPIIQNSSFDRLLETGEIRTFRLGSSKAEFLWNSISGTFDMLFSDKISMEEHYLQEAKKVHELKMNFAKQETPLVVVMQDFFGLYNAMFFGHHPGVNIVIPYLSAIDFTEENSERFKESISTMSNSNDIIEIELPDDVVENMHLHKVEGIPSKLKFPFSDLQELIYEFRERIIADVAKSNTSSQE